MNIFHFNFVYSKVLLSHPRPVKSKYIYPMLARSKSHTLGLQKVNIYTPGLQKSKYIYPLRPAKSKSHILGLQKVSTYIYPRPAKSKYMLPVLQKVNHTP